MLVPSAGTRADSGSWFLPLDIWGQKSFDFRGSCSHNVPARNRTVSLLFKAGPDSLSASWCAKPSPEREPAFFFLPNSQVPIPLGVLQRAEQPPQLRQEFRVFLNLFWKEGGGIGKQQCQCFCNLSWSYQRWSLTFCPCDFAVWRWRERMVKLWMLGPQLVRKKGVRKQRRASWDLVWTTKVAEKWDKFLN